MPNKTYAVFFFFHFIRVLCMAQNERNNKKNDFVYTHWDEEKKNLFVEKTNRFMCSTWISSSEIVFFFSLHLNHRKTNNAPRWAQTARAQCAQAEEIYCIVHKEPGFFYSWLLLYSQYFSVVHTSASSSSLCPIQKKKQFSTGVFTQFYCVQHLNYNHLRKWNKIKCQNVCAFTLLIISTDRRILFCFILFVRSVVLFRGFLMKINTNNKTNIIFASKGQKLFEKTGHLLNQLVIFNQWLSTQYNTVPNNRNSSDKSILFIQVHWSVIGSWRK